VQPRSEFCTYLVRNKVDDIFFVS